MFVTVTGVQPHIKSRKVRALAVSTPKRSDMLPGVPTVAEAALPGFEMLSWFGLLAPAGTPPAVVTRINADTAKVLALPDVKAALLAQGLEVISGTPEQFGNYIKTEIAKITRLAKATGIKAE